MSVLIYLRRLRLIYAILWTPSFQTVIPRNVRLAEAPSYGKPIILYDIRSRGAESYLQLAREVMSNDKTSTRPGLSALLSETAAATSEELLEIDIDLIEPNSAQPRLRFDETRLNELAESIRHNGVVQPILLRRRGQNYQIVAGERRWRAAQKAGLQRIPAVVREIPDDKLLELALIENIQRQELNAIEEARAYKKLIETLGLTQENVAQRVGRDRTFITNYLRLLRLPDDIQHLVEDEKISMGHARALLGVDDPAIQRRVARSITEHSLSVRETENNQADCCKRQLYGNTCPCRQKDDANVRAAESKLRRRLSTQVRVLPSQTGKGGK
jgi:ParB family chromosome partitioning protein